MRAAARRSPLSKKRGFAQECTSAINFASVTEPRAAAYRGTLAAGLNTRDKRAILHRPRAKTTAIVIRLFVTSRKSRLLAAIVLKKTVNRPIFNMIQRTQQARTSRLKFDFARREGSHGRFQKASRTKAARANIAT